METSTSSCDRCRKEVPSAHMVYWLIEIWNRGVRLPAPDVAIGSPKYCKACAQEVKAKLKDAMGEDLRFLD